ncbi:MAG TPA: hypothetical protein VK671_07470 [Mucilaginibacter sp.]|jgi:hypothetical protein|nr:hypothetical protein [Mucilaginibacter sp.]
MKNLFKSGILTLIIGISVVACDPPKGKQENTPVDSNKTAIDTTQKTIDTAKKVETDAVKKDSVKK